MELSGWGRHPRIEAEILTPPGPAAVGVLLAAGGAALIPRGAGRSYGDSALAATVLSSRYLDHFLEFDRPRLRLRCGAGLTLGEILALIVPHGAFLPVLPGTRFVTIGGAIAADIHGKNHHVDGSFCDHVSELRLALADGEIVRCSRAENAELFAATCGGMGLTGVILETTLELMPIVSPCIRNRTLAAANLEDCLATLNAHRDSKYAVAWIDCLSRGERLGRGIVHLGEHATESAPLTVQREGLSLGVPFTTPASLLNRYSMATFNALYYYSQRRRSAEEVPYNRYFFPLDRLRHWNRLYGRRGFLQYQLVLPDAGAAIGLRAILERVAASGQGSFLSVLKQFGPGNDNLLSFPRTGFTLALDFKLSTGVLALLEQLDEIVREHEGRLYLAKDARMSQAMFKSGYPHRQRFLEIKRQVDPDDRFTSLQARRLGLSARAARAARGTGS